MKTLEQRSFQKSEPVFAFRSFIAHGRRFDRGSAFDWQALGVAAEKVELLYRAGKVRHYPPGDANVDISKNGLGDPVAEEASEIAPAKRGRPRKVTE